MEKTKILILGASGMLGHMLLNIMSRREDIEVKGTIRHYDSLTESFYKEHNSNLYLNVSVLNFDSIRFVIDEYKPDVIINAIGIIKQIKEAFDPITSITINSLFPHTLCNLFDKHIRVIHISTDCVFDGKKGSYTEDDTPSPLDLYGRSKLLGEVTSYENSITLRTSIIGHELKSKFGLLEWFISQEGKSVKGFSNAIYSGFPVTELEKIIYDYILRSNLKGLFHVSSDPINKYDLLNIVKEEYQLNIDIENEKNFNIDRSMNCDKFIGITGYKRKCWVDMVKDMKSYFDLNKKIYK